MIFSAKKKSRLKRQYQIEQQRAVPQFRRIGTEQNTNIQMILTLAEVVGLLQQRFGSLLWETGLTLMQAVKKRSATWLVSAMNNTKHDARIAQVRKRATA